jgi:small subunit ribosomal protein S5
VRAVSHSNHMEENKTTVEAAGAKAPIAPRKVSFNRAPNTSSRPQTGSTGFQGRTGGGPRSSGPRGPRTGGPGGNSRGPRTGGPGGGRREVVKPEYDSKTINVRRVTRVVAGGRRFSFSVAVVIGNRAGLVGVGIGKAGDTGLAIQKAFNAAKKAMIKVPLTDTKSITNEVSAKESSARAMLKPNFGKGLVAGSSLRTVLELAGISDVTAKVLSPSRNKLNNARVAIAALAKLRS